jgi:hypothetical protein
MPETAEERSPKMGEKYTAEDHLEFRRRQDEQAKKEEEANRERTEKESARRVWLADGGREANFEKEWPKLRDEGRRQRVIDADRRARELQRSSTTSRI